MKTESPQMPSSCQKNACDAWNPSFCSSVSLSVSWRGGFQGPSQNAEPAFAHVCLPLAVFTELLPAEETEQDKEHTCETLLMCIVTVLSHGLRSGGGVGDVLRKPSKEVLHPPPTGGGGGGGGCTVRGTRAAWAGAPGPAAPLRATSLSVCHSDTVQGGQCSSHT